MLVEAFDWTNVGIGVLVGLGAALAAVGGLLVFLNRRARAGRKDWPEP